MTETPTHQLQPLRKTRIAGKLNVIFSILCFVLLIAFFFCLFSGIFGSGVKDEDNPDQSGNGEINIVITWVIFLPLVLILFMPFSQLLGVWLLIFGIILTKTANASISDTPAKPLTALHVVSIIIRIICFASFVFGAIFVTAMISAGGTPVLAILFCVYISVVGLYTIAGIVVELRSKTERKRYNLSLSTQPQQ